MEMKIFMFLVTVWMFSKLTHQQTTPEERCEASTGGSVCIDCFTSGTCVQNEDGSWTVDNDTLTCPSGVSFVSYCDDSLFTAGTYGSCSPISADETNCSCSGGQCIADPNNPAAILHCESTTPSTDSPCSYPVLDLETCSCLSCSDTCPFVDDPNDSCSSYYVCTGSDLIQISCAEENLCFDPDSCSCAEPQTTTTPLVCPDDCPLVDDPDDSCQKYFVCTDSDLISINCSENTCFDQASCGCIEGGGGSTKQVTTILTTIVPDAITTTSTVSCSSDCPFVDDPNDECSSFFICYENTLIASECPGVLCFDQEQCECV